MILYFYFLSDTNPSNENYNKSRFRIKQNVMVKDKIKKKREEKEKKDSVKKYARVAWQIAARVGCTPIKLHACVIRAKLQSCNSCHHLLAPNANSCHIQWPNLYIKASITYFSTTITFFYTIMSNHTNRFHNLVELNAEIRDRALSCDVCQYGTDRRSNYTRHLSSESHRLNVANAILS